MRRITSTPVFHISSKALASLSNPKLEEKQVLSPPRHLNVCLGREWIGHDGCGVVVQPRLPREVSTVKLVASFPSVKVAPRPTISRFQLGPFPWGFGRAETRVV